MAILSSLVVSQECLLQIVSDVRIAVTSGFVWLEIETLFVGSGVLKDAAYRSLPSQCSIPL